jgi:hypothetical protein
LRQQDASQEILTQSNQEWELVGDAYIQGIMDGEAIKMMENGELKSQIFTLR